MLAHRHGRLVADPVHKRRRTVVERAEDDCSTLVCWHGSQHLGLVRNHLHAAVKSASTVSDNGQPQMRTQQSTYPISQGIGQISIISTLPSSLLKGVSSVSYAVLCRWLAMS